MGSQQYYNIVLLEHTLSVSDTFTVAFTAATSGSVPKETLSHSELKENEM